MAESIRYGHVEGPGKGREYKVKADQYISRRGGKFVYIDTDGLLNVNSSANNTKVMGWAVTPKDAAGYNAWKSSSTDRGDNLFVIYGIDDVYEMPVHANSTLTATFIGMGAKIVEAGSTYTTIQYAYVGATAASPLSIVDIETDGTDRVYVKIKAAYKQDL